MTELARTTTVPEVRPLPSLGSVWKHVKGGHYLVLADPAKNADTSTKIVVYVPLYLVNFQLADPTWRTYVDFMDRHSSGAWRFTKVDPRSYACCKSHGPSYAIENMGYYRRLTGHRLDTLCHLTRRPTS